MGYAGVKGGLDAIHAAEELVARLKAQRVLTDEDVRDGLRLLVDRVQGEGALWAPDLAARAVLQAEGDVIEAVHLLRALRSALPRFPATLPVSLDDLVPLRRIVPAYRTPPGPQLLGRTVDYVGRRLDTAADLQPPPPANQSATDDDVAAVEAATSSRLLDLLRERDLVVDRRDHDEKDPIDITTTDVATPAPRSARLAMLARGETGALVNLWYQGVRGPTAHQHEITLGEVRHGRLPVRVPHPATGGVVDIGAIDVTEVEAYADVHSTDDDRFRFDAGHGLCLGHNERKAIAMAILDVQLTRADDPDQEQAVLGTIDGLDATGFLEHLKLPHYVTFRSMIERKDAQRTAASAGSAPA